MVTCEVVSTVKVVSTSPEEVDDCDSGPVAVELKESELPDPVGPGPEPEGPYPYPDSLRVCSSGLTAVEDPEPVLFVQSGSPRLFC